VTIVNIDPRDMMHLGFSKSWPEALETMTGTPEMSAKSFITYFLPLYDFLEQENKANGECVGWGGETFFVRTCLF
jgi:peptidyl-dipeptidase A